MHPAAGDARFGDGGFTFIEVLIAIAILGIAFVAIVGGMATTIVVSDHHRQQAQAEAVVISAMDKVKAATYDATCNTSATVAAYKLEADEAAADAGWSSPSSRIALSLKYWDGFTATYQNVCHDTVTDLVRLQEVTVTATHPDGRASYERALVKAG